MAPDRRFGLPHPLDVEPSKDSSSERKPGLWESLKRALAAPAIETRPPRPDRREALDLPLPAASPPASPLSVSAARSGDERPALPVEPRRLEEPIADEVPFLGDAGPNEPPPPPPPPSPPVARADAEAPSASSDPVAPSQPTSGRLARGLASFSRENAQREKKYAHLLRDAKAGKGPSGSGKPG